jgi:hypothetical protein
MLSYILDSKFYNKYVRFLKQRKSGRIKINENKFFAVYSFNGRNYYGECFDYRLIRENILKEDFNDGELSNFFEMLTKKKGITKFFIGLDENIIKAINKKDIAFLNHYNSTNEYIDQFNLEKFLDKDGILIIKSKNGEDKQLERIFTEEEVKIRLGYHIGYIKKEPHQCGAPCRSRDIKGKPCEIMTFRSNCHFHR